MFTVLVLIILPNIICVLNTFCTFFKTVCGHTLVHVITTQYVNNA